MKIPTAIAIRSFDLNGTAFKKLERKTEVIFINTSGNRLSEPELGNAIKGAEGVIAGTESYSAAVLRAAPSLKVISRVGIGIDNIDLNFTKTQGICVKNTPNAPVDAVAEHTVALVFSVWKKIAQYNEQVHHGDYSVHPGTLLSGKTAGIIGLGKIGRKVATLLEALGMKIIFFDPWIQVPAPDTWSEKKNLEDLLQESDLISLHTPAQRNDRPLLDREHFLLCKKGTVLINTARGSLIDEPSLVFALEQKTIAAAGLDVVSMEPYKGPLLGFPQVVITPHVASNTVESRQQMEIEAVENMLNALGI